ncbi:ABC transporter C-terminal domain-containing protein, partial [Streptomyces sp. MBT55]|uniref:ABC transporter C-terminal domain-containing protein n=1 Tax=Streptomyces sp. MBT55 TaxID=1488386 RepID=UPI001A54FE0A
EYLERRQKLEEAATPSAAAPRSSSAPAAAPAVSAQASRAAKKELQKVERQLDKLSTRETTLHKQIADNATDFEKVAGLDAELRELVTERDELEMRWLELAEDA